MSYGNGHSRVPIDVIDLQFPQVVDIPPPLPPKRPLWPAIVMFLLTVITTLAVGSLVAFAAILAGSALTMKVQYWRITRET